jgi:hypothetical protein
MDELLANQCCTVDFRDFLSMIQRDMLVVHHNGEMQEGNGGLMPQGSLSGSLGVPGQNSRRRKSCGNIFRTLGGINPRCDQEEDLSRHNTFEAI